MSAPEDMDGVLDSMRREAWAAYVAGDAPCPVGLCDGSGEYTYALCEMVECPCSAPAAYVARGALALFAWLLGPVVPARDSILDGLAEVRRLVAAGAGPLCICGVRHRGECPPEVSNGR